MKKYLCVIGLFVAVMCCLCGCNEEAVVSDNAPIETEVQTSKEEIVINKPDSREKVLFSAREYRFGEKKYIVSMYGMQSAEDEEKYSDFRIEMRDDKNFLMLNTPLDMGEYGDSLFTVKENDRSKSFKFEGLKSENDTLVPLFSLQLLLDDVTLEKAVYRSFFKIKDGKIEYFTLKDEIAADFDDLGESYTITDNKIILYGNMATNEIYGDFLYDDLYFATRRITGGVVYKTMDFTDRGDEYTANLIITNVNSEIEEVTYAYTIKCKVNLDITNKNTNKSCHFTKEYTFYGNPYFDMNIYQMKTDTGTDKALIWIDIGADNNKELYYVEYNTIEMVSNGEIYDIENLTIDGCNFVNKNNEIVYTLYDNMGYLSINEYNYNDEITDVETYGNYLNTFMRAMKEGNASGLFPIYYQHYYEFLDQCEFSVVERSEITGIDQVNENTYAGVIKYVCTKSANKDIIAENTESALMLYMSDMAQDFYVKLRYNNEGYEDDYLYKTYLGNCDLTSDAKYNKAYIYECLFGGFQSHDKITLDANDKDIIEKLRLMSSAGIPSITYKRYTEESVSVSDIDNLAEHFGLTVNPKESKYYIAGEGKIDRDRDFYFNRYFASTLSKDDENNTVTIAYYADPLLLFEVKVIEYKFNDIADSQLISTKVIRDNGGEVGYFG